MADDERHDGADDTRPDDIPSPQILEAAELEDRKVTEALLASFDRPLGRQRASEGRDFVEYYTSKRGDDPVRPRRRSPFDDPPSVIDADPRARRTTRSRWMIVAFVSFAVLGVGVTAFVAAGNDEPPAPPPTVGSPSPKVTLPSLPPSSVPVADEPAPVTEPSSASSVPSARPGPRRPDFARSLD